MADCIEQKTSLQKFVSILPVAAMITILVTSIGFGVAWGQIREEVTVNKQTIKEEQVQRIEISKQLSSISTDIKWLIEAEQKRAKGE